MKVGENLESWADIFSEVVWAYRTTIKTPTSHTSLPLAFGLEVIAPSELVMPTRRVLGYEKTIMKKCR